MACDIFYQNPAYFSQIDNTVDLKKIDQFFSKYANGIFKEIFIILFCIYVSINGCCGFIIF